LLHTDAASDPFFIPDRSGVAILNIGQLVWLDFYRTWIIGHYPSCMLVFFGSSCRWIQSERRNGTTRETKTMKKQKANKAQILWTLHTWLRIYQYN
jgi:hypothetical protein